MAQFACYVLPNYSFSTLYYLPLQPPAPADPLPTQTITTISSFQELKSFQTTERLQLSRDELLAAGYERKKRVWTAQEDERLLELISVQNVPWREIEQHMADRTQKMCYSRYRRLLAEARQRWAPQEEQKLKDLVEAHGEAWKEFAPSFPSKTAIDVDRTWKQLRDKYLNYLRPNINKDEWSLEEDMKILELIGKHGTKWKSIQLEMQHRTDNQIKNRYYGRLKILLKRKARRRTKRTP